MYLNFYLLQGVGKMEHSEILKRKKYENLTDTIIQNSFKARMFCKKVLGLSTDQHLARIYVPANPWEC